MAREIGIRALQTQMPFDEVERTTRRGLEDHNIWIIQFIRSRALPTQVQLFKDCATHVKNALNVEVTVSPRCRIRRLVANFSRLPKSGIECRGG